MNDILQRARDIAADQYIRLEMKRPTSHQTLSDWSEHVARYASFTREGWYDDGELVQIALAALRGSAA